MRRTSHDEKALAKRNLNSQTGLDLASITSVSSEALAKALLVVAKTSVGALGNVLVVGVRVGEKLVHVERRRERLSGISVEVHRHVQVNVVGALVLHSGQSIVVVVLSSLSLADSVNGVHVDVSRVGARSAGAIEGKRNDNVSLVDTVTDPEVGVLGLAGVVLARDVTGESTLGDHLGTEVGTIGNRNTKVSSGIGGDHLLATEVNADLRELGGSGQHALGGVHLVLVLSLDIEVVEGVQEAELGGSEDDGHVVATIRLRSGGEHKLHQMRVVIGANIPIVNALVVGIDVIGSSEASLQQLSLSGGKRGKNLAGSTGVDGDRDAIAMVAEVVDVLALLPIGPHHSLDLGSGVLKSASKKGSGGKRGAASIQHGLDLGLLQLAGVVVELNAVRITGVKQSASTSGTGGVKLDGRGEQSLLGSGGNLRGGHASHHPASSVGASGGDHGAQVVGHGGDHFVGQRVQGVDHLGARGASGDGLGHPVLAVHVEEANGPVASALVVHTIVEVGGAGRSGLVHNSEIPGGVLHGAGVVHVQLIDGILAQSLGAVGAGETRVTLATHGDISVPQLVDVLVVGVSQLANGLAHTVAGARLGEAGARGALAGGTVVAGQALALARVSVAGSLVGALHVVVGGVGQVGQIRGLHARKLLGGSVGVGEVVLHDDLIRTTHHVVVVKISLRGVDVGQAELADTLTAVIGLPVALAHAHVVTGASSVAIASIGTLSVHHQGNIGREGSD
jgi:hypothetical protein